MPEEELTDRVESGFIHWLRKENISLGIGIAGGALFFFALTLPFISSNHPPPPRPEIKCVYNGNLAKYEARIVEGDHSYLIVDKNYNPAILDYCNVRK